MTDSEILILCILIGMTGIQLPTFILMRYLLIKQREIFRLLNILHNVKQMNEQFDGDTIGIEDAAR